MQKTKKDFIESKGHEGVAYGRKPPHSNDRLARVGPGTPCGEYMRRYWHPIGRSDEVTARPRKVRVLGEDLILFRDSKGRPGLLYPRCMHRGTTLYYGKVEEKGIRCCYHGWLFDVEGKCLEQPCEPKGGIGRRNIRQPWYPVEEQYGLVFAYLGPPERKPLLPKFDVLEKLPTGYQVYALASGSLACGDDSAGMETTPYNWLQDWENIMDPYHVWVLHSNFSSVQFVEGFKVMPEVKFEKHPLGAVYHAHRKFNDGKAMVRTSFAILPYAASVPSVLLEEGPSRQIVWFRPVDDTNFIIYIAEARKEPHPPIRIPMTPDGRSWSQMTEEEHQDYPGDFEAQYGQGEITFHSEEHLVKSDVGIDMLRRKTLEQIKIVENGGDPAGVAFENGHEVIKVMSGNFFK